MHKHIGLLLSTAFLGIFIFVPGVSDKLFALFFIGAVPFTHYILPASTMLAIYALLLALGIYAVARLSITATSEVKRDIKARERARKKVLQSTAKTHPKTKPTHPKKRYQTAVEN